MYLYFVIINNFPLSTKNKNKKQKTIYSHAFWIKWNHWVADFSLEGRHCTWYSFHHPSISYACEFLQSISNLENMVTFQSNKWFYSVRTTTLFNQIFGTTYKLELPALSHSHTNTYQCSYGTSPFNFILFVTIAAA